MSEIEKVVLMRHALSEENMRCELILTDRLYERFIEIFKNDPYSIECRVLAERIIKKYGIGVEDRLTPIAPHQEEHLFRVGCAVREYYMEMKSGFPDVVILSPFVRAWQTFNLIKRGFPELNFVHVFEEKLIREQNHGEVHNYTRWELYGALNPESHQHFKRVGHYHFHCPGGESSKDVHLHRVKPFLSKLRKMRRKRPFIISHAIVKMLINCEIAGTGEYGFVDDFHNRRPDNCSIMTLCPCQTNRSGFDVESFNRRLV